MSNQLLPCPFCGGDAGKNEHTEDCYFTARQAVIDAEKGDVSGVPEMLRAWNRRATQPAAGEPVACRHRLADARNKHISSGYFCVDCGAAFAAADHAAPPAAAHGDEAVRKDAAAAYVDMSCNSVLIDGATCYYLPAERMAAFDRMFSLGDAMRAQGDGDSRHE